MSQRHTVLSRLVFLEQKPEKWAGHGFFSGRITRSIGVVLVPKPLVRVHNLPPEHVDRTHLRVRVFWKRKQVHSPREVLHCIRLWASWHAEDEQGAATCILLAFI
ncbi:uncharacterized protein LOC118147684 isoform X2 [Callithrix jacchus]